MRGVLAGVVTCALWFGAAFAAEPEAKGEPLVSVNGHIIATSELETQLRMLSPLAAHASGSPASTAMDLEQVDTQRRRDALQALIERRLLYDVARDAYLGNEQAEKVLDAAAEDELRKFEERVGSMPTARRVLAGFGLTVGQYKELQKEGLLANKLLWDKVFSNVLVTPAETRQYYDDHAEEFARPRTVVFRQMLFVVVDQADEQARRGRAEAALKRVRAGDDFAQVAKDLSADAGADPGGVQRVGVPKSLPDWLPPAVDGLKPGQTSEVRRLQAGYSVARLEEIRPPGPQPFEEVQPAIKDALLQSKRAVARAAYVDGLRAKARIEYLPAGRELMPR
jgi:parvulin-like peptidyl-prolyl isomerase